MDKDEQKLTGIPHPCRKGFALMGLLVTVAVIAIMAGVLGPMVYRQMMEAKAEETRQEMLALEDGLMRFFADTGRFPTEGEGLSALTTDPGTNGWQGPYLVGDRYSSAVELSTDGFGEDYAFDRDPTTNPVATTDLLLVSGGTDNTITSGAVGGTWDINDPGNDILVFIDAGPTNRNKTVQARQEMQDLSEAARKYFQDNSLLPLTTGDLSSTYQDASFSGGAFVDPWLENYILDVDNGTDPPTMTITSWGPNRTDDSGGGDDLVLFVDTVVPGRRSTYHMIRIAQAMVDAKPSVALSGDWDADRPDFELAAAFNTDGWNNLYEVAMSTRTVLSAGPDGDYFTAADNIPPGVIPDDDSGSDPIEYVDGSGEAGGNHCNTVSFQITNTTTGDLTLNAATISWPTPTGYYGKLIINGTQLAIRNNPKFASGETVAFSSPFVLTAGSTVVVELQQFTKKNKGNAQKLNMSDVDITVVFDDGTTISFTTPTCN